MNLKKLTKVLIRISIVMVLIMEKPTILKWISIEILKSKNYSLKISVPALTC